MRLAKTSDPLADRISDVLTDFTEWLDAYSETSWDYQSFFAGPVGGRAKALYYRDRLIGTAAVAPMIFCEAFVPAARRLFHTVFSFQLWTRITRWALLSFTRRPEISRNWKTLSIF
jgi:hypothetical protein